MKDISIEERVVAYSKISSYNGENAKKDDKNELCVIHTCLSIYLSYDYCIALNENNKTDMIG